MIMDPRIKDMMDKAKEIARSFDGTFYKLGIIRNEDAFFGKVGDLVRIKSVHEGEDHETFFGILVGQEFKDNPKGLEKILGTGNPAIYVFGLDAIRCGYESWWGKIPEKDLEELEYDQLLEKYKVTRETIDNAIFTYITKAMELAKTNPDVNESWE